MMHISLGVESVKLVSVWRNMWEWYMSENNYRHPTGRNYHVTIKMGIGDWSHIL